MAKPKIKRFEVFLGNQWQSWVASDTVTITNPGRTVKIVTDHDQFGVFATIIDLDQVPAYTIQ